MRRPITFVWLLLLHCEAFSSAETALRRLASIAAEQQKQKRQTANLRVTLPVDEAIETLKSELDVIKNEDECAVALKVGEIQEIVAENEEDAEAEEAAEETERLIIAYLAFFLVSLLGAAVLQWLISLVPHYQLPASIAWFVYGMALDALFAWWPNTDGTMHNALVLGVKHIATMNAEVVYLVLLPILLYDAALHVDWHKFKRFAISGTTLAVFGVAYQIALVGILVQVSFPTSKLMSSSTSWFNSFLIGSALASTDPVAVISVLNALQAPPKLSTMFEGESLINDGTSMLLFQFFKSLAHGHTETAGVVMRRFVTLLLLSPVWGAFTCYATYVWIRRCHLNAPSVSIAPVAVAYVTYLVGEKVLNCSGPLAIVAFGLCWNAFGHIGLERHAQEHHHHAVQALANLANSSVFVVAGVVAMRMMHDSLTADDGISSNEIWNVPILYAYLLIARASMVLLCTPILRKTGYGVNWKESLLLIWGGLRGAIVLAMGLMIEQDFAILKFMRYEAVLYIAGSTFLILLINGATFELLYNILTPYPPKPFRRVYLEKIMKLVDLQYMEERAVLEDHWLFRNTDALKIADASAPILGWRKMNERGRINVTLPSVATALKVPPDMSHWQPPSDCFVPTENLSPTASDANQSGREIHGVTDVPGTLDAKLLIRVTEATAAAAEKAHIPLSVAATATMADSLPPTSPAAAEERVRAQEVASSAQGLRDAKKLNFDAKYYLRLLEHVTESSADGRNAAEKIQILHPAEEQDIRRFDTDKTLVLPNLVEQPPSRVSVGSRLRKLFSGGSNSRTFEHRHSAGDVLADDPSMQRPGIKLPDFRRGQSDRGPDATVRSYSVHRREGGSTPQTARLSGDHETQPKNDNTTFQNDTAHRMEMHHFPSPQNRSHSLDESLNCTRTPPRHHRRAGLLFQEDQVHSSTLESEVPNAVSQRVGFAVPSAMSEPFGGARLDVGRMTRLRRPEWDSRSFHRIPHGVQSTISGVPETPSGAFDWQVVHRYPAAATNKSSTNRSSAEDPYAQANLINFEALQAALDEKETKQPMFTRLKHRMRGRRPSQPNERALTTSPRRDNSTRSIASHEEYIEMPFTPVRLRNTGESTAVARVKVLRVEREGELYIMVFNAIRQMYGKLYRQHFIGGSAMLSLCSTLDHATDFAIGKLRRNPVRAWREVLSNIPEGISTEWVTHVPGVGEGMTGFEFEWRALVTRLRCIDRRNVLGRLAYRLCPSQTWMRASCSFTAARCDLEQLAAFVDVHEELLFKGGASLAELLGAKLMGSYRRQISDAKKFVLVLRAAYPEALPYAVAVHASTLLIHLKKQLVEEQFEKGLINDEDFKMFVELLEEQIQNLEAYTPGGFLMLLSWMHERICCGRETRTAQKRQDVVVTTTQCEAP